MAETKPTFNKFLPTTVFDLKIFDPKSTDPTKEEAVIESLKIANFTQEGPTKTARGGKNNAILARYGKETRLEMEDAIVNIKVLEYLMGADVSKPGEIQIKDTFPEEVRLEGTTFFIDTETGKKIEATFEVPRFFPDGLFNLTMEAEGDFGVIEIGGEVIADECGNFYTITTTGKYESKKAEAGTAE